MINTNIITIIIITAIDYNESQSPPPPPPVTTIITNITNILIPITTQPPHLRNLPPATRHSSTTLPAKGQRSDRPAKQAKSRTQSIHNKALLAITVLLFVLPEKDTALQYQTLNAAEGVAVPLNFAVRRSFLLLTNGAASG